MKQIHVGCGGEVKLEWQWWEDWGLWMDMVYCVKCGGPLVPNEVEPEV